MHYATLCRYADRLDTQAAQIAERWVSTPHVGAIFERHGIDPSLFARHFGVRVIHYFLGVLRGVERLGNCPVIGVMLDFFHRKEIRLAELFLICDDLKRQLLQTLEAEEPLEAKALEELFFVMGHNFVGVIDDYMHKNGIDTAPSAIPQPPLTLSLPDTEKIAVTDEDLEALTDVEEDIDRFVLFFGQGGTGGEEEHRFLNALRHTASLFSGYSALNLLGEELLLFARAFEQYNELAYNARDRFTTLLECFQNDLITWRRLLACGEADTAVERGLVSGLQQMRLLLGEESDEEMELF